MLGRLGRTSGFATSGDGGGGGGGTVVEPDLDFWKTVYVSGEAGDDAATGASPGSALATVGAALTKLDGPLGRVVLSYGQHFIAAPLVVANTGGLIIEGQGVEGTWLSHTDDYAEPALSFGDLPVTLRGFRAVVGDGHTFAAFTSGGDQHVCDVSFNGVGGGTAIDITGNSYQPKISRCSFTGLTPAILFTTGAELAAITDCRFQSCDPAIDVHAGYGTVIDRCVFFGDYGRVVVGIDAEDTKISSCRFISFGLGDAVVVEGGALRTRLVTNSGLVTNLGLIVNDQGQDTRIIDRGLPMREVASVTTIPLATDEVDEVQIRLAPSYRLMKIETSQPARVRVYATGWQRIDDSARPIGTDPVGDHGLVLEFVTTAELLSMSLSPVVEGFNGDPPDFGSLSPSPYIPLLVQNLDPATEEITVTFTWIATEA